MVAKSSTSFCLGKGRKVTAAGLQVTLCGGMWFPVAVRWFPRTAISALLTLLTYLYCSVLTIASAIWRANDSMSADVRVHVLSPAPVNWSSGQYWTADEPASTPRTIEPSIRHRLNISNNHYCDHTPNKNLYRSKHATIQVPRLSHYHHHYRHHGRFILHLYTN